MNARETIMELTGEVTNEPTKELITIHIKHNDDLLATRYVLLSSAMCKRLATKDLRKLILDSAIRSLEQLREKEKN